MERKYGLFTACCMIVGTVIGSGVFFKAQTILQRTEGNMPLGILAWIIGGAIMIICILAFSMMAQKYERVNGLIDYAEATVGPKYAYYVGWFNAVIYTPCLTCVLAWLSARYTLTFITSCWPNFPLLEVAGGAIPGEIVGPECMALTLLYVVLGYAVNGLSPKLAGKLQTSTTVIKFIPLVLMAVVGIIGGLLSPTHMLGNNFTYTGGSAEHMGRDLLAAVCSTAFAYEGWIITTSINAELRDSRRNLPKALIIGGIVVVCTYVLYYIGVAGGASVQELMDKGATTAFVNVFGGVFGNILNLFVAVSCLGTMNGLMMGCTRGIYALAAREAGPAPELFCQVDKKSNMANNSAILGVLLCAIWGFYFYITNLMGTLSSLTVFKGTILESNPFVFDSSEISIITLYAMYVPIFLMWMKKEKDEGVLRRFVLPSLAVVGSLFMVYACIVSHRAAVLWYLIVFTGVMLLGRVFYKKKAV